MIIYLEKMETEEFKDFVSKINSLQPDEKVKVILDNTWGVLNIKNYVLDILNSLWDRVELVWWMLFSCAFTLFDEFKWKKYLMPSAYWMVHSEAWSVDMGFDWIPRWDQDKFIYEFKKKTKAHKYDWMTPEQKQKYEWGWDVWLDYEQLKIAFNLNN